MTALIRFTVGCLIVAAFVYAVALAQGIGEVLGGGLVEYMVR